MMHTLNRSPAPLRDVLYEFSLSKDVPDAELLDDFVRRYPEHSAELTDFAVELAIESLRREEPFQAAGDSTALSPEVSRAISRFQNAFHAVLAGRPPAAKREATQAAEPVNPFASLDRAAFRALAQDLDVNAVFLCKLRDRQIDPKTMPKRFEKLVANKLKVPPGVVAAHLAAAPARVEQPQFYKADQKPEIGARQSFEEAVRSSGLTEAQQRSLMAL